MRRVLLLLVAVAACADDGPGPAPVGSATASAQTTGSGISTTGATGPADSSADTGPSAQCKACWQGACDPEIQACYTDDVCACMLQCDEEFVCEQACGSSQPFNAVLDCILDASVGPCVGPCDARCAACVLSQCEAEADACSADSTCVCKFRCDGEAPCEAACGDSDVLFDALGQCFFVAASGVCVADC